MQPGPFNADDDIDRKSLRALRERFLGLNRERLDALRARLSDDQRTFIDAVPLLLHSNHAALPGFVDFDMPCGIDRYTPDRRALNAVRKIALSFVLERFVERRSQIQAVCVTAMPGSTLELGVCSAFPTHAALTEKLSRLVRYAADHGVVLATTLLVDPAEEHAGRSRLRTPCLARDAFYRSAILLAGRYPVWWLVPPQLDAAHDAYSARLKSQRFIGRDETFDLGRADPIPRGECLTAGVEWLDAALTAPYAHLPSLMLLESYASDSNVAPLALAYKKRIWGGDTEVDSSTLLDESIAAYLTARGEPERLALARDCRRAPSLEPTIAELQRENTRVNTELQRAHGHLLRLASEPAGSAGARVRLTATGDRIARLIGRRHGTITRLNPALWPRRVAGWLRVEPHADGWRLHDGDAPVFAAPRLAAAIAWAHAHRLGIDNLRLAEPRRQPCARMLELLSQYDGGKTATPSTLLLINAEEAPQFALRAPGDAIVSDWDDPLDFSGFHISLIAGVDVLEVRDDGIVATGRAADDGLIDVLVGLLSNPPATLHVHCVGGERDHAIEQRVGELVARMSEAFQRNQVGRFVFALAAGFVIVERNGDRFTARRCANEPQLFEALASPNRGALSVDARGARLRSLRDLCSIAVPDQDTLLIHEQRGSVAILLAMRDGSTHRFIPPQQSAHEVADDVRELVAQAGVRTPEIYVVKANDKPLRIAGREPKRASQSARAGVAAPVDLAALLRRRFTSGPELARRPTVA